MQTQTIEQEIMPGQGADDFLHIGNRCADCGNSTRTLCGLPIDSEWGKEDPDLPAECVVCDDLASRSAICEGCGSAVW